MSEFSPSIKELNGGIILKIINIKKKLLNKLIYKFFI